MPTYYCYECARLHGHISPVDASAVSANSYQLGKFIKHTAPTGNYPVNSIFNDPDWSSYQDFMVTTANSGCLEVDDQGRSNLIWFAGEETGLRYDSGMYSASCSGVKVVLAENSGTIHAFPSDFHPESKTCGHCGKSVPYDNR